MPQPIRNFSYNSKWVCRTIRFCWVAWEFFICQVWVIFNWSRWFYQINSFPSFPKSKFGTPDSGIQCRSQKNVFSIFSLSIVGVETNSDQVTNF